MRTASGPAIIVAPSALNGLVATQGAPGIGTNFFTASGSNLSNNITVSVPGPNFQISTNTNTSLFTSSFELPTNASGVVAETPIYVRLTGTTAGTFTTNVSLTSGTNSTNVSVTGTVVPPPTLTALPSTISGLTATQGSAGVSSNFVVSGANLAGNITVTANDATNFAVSVDNIAFANTLTLTNSGGVVTSTPVFVRLTGTNIGPFTNTVTASTSGAAATNVTVSGTVSPPPPSLSVSTNTLTGFNTVQPNPSGAQTFDVSGSNLTANVTVTPPAGFQVSTNGISFSSLLTLVPSGATLASTTIFVHLIGSTPGSFSGDVNVTSTGASPRAVAVSGNVAAAGSPSIEPGNGFALPGFQAVLPNASDFKQITVSGTNLTAPITITPPTGWQISATNNGNPVSTPIVLATNPAQIVSNTPVFIRIAPGQTTPATLTSNALTLASGSLTNTVFLSGSVINPAPALSVSNSMTNFSTTSLSNTSDVQSFTASGTFLTSNITVTSSNSNDFEISLTNNAGWGSVLELTNNGTVSNRPVYVRMTGKTAGANNGIIGLVSGSAATNIIVNGTVPTPLITLNTNALSGFNTQAGTVSSSSNVVVTGGNLGTNNITVVSTNSAYEMSTNSFATTGSLLTLPPSGGTLAVRISASATATNNLPGRLVFSSLGFSTNVSLSGTVTAPAAVTLNMPPSLAQGNSDVGTVSLPSPPPNNVLVTLACSAPSLMTIPATVVIPAGTNSVEFPIATTGGAATTSVTTIALAAGYAQGTATTVLDGDGSVASFTIAGYQQSFSSFTDLATRPVGWSITAEAGADSYTAWGTTTSGAKVSTTGTNVFGFQHTGTTGVAEQVLTLRNDSGVVLTNFSISYRGRATRTNETRTPFYNVSTVIGTTTNTNTGLFYSTAGANPDNQLRSATNTNVQIPPGGIFQIVWRSDRGSNNGTSRTIGISDVRLTSSITPVPTITATPSSIGGFSTTTGTASVPQVSFVAGTNLATNITITPPVGFEVSTNSAFGFGTSSLTLLRAGNGVPQTPLYFRVASSVAPGVLGGTVNLASTNGISNAGTTILLSAMVFSSTAGAQVLADKTSLGGFSTPSPTDSAPQTFQVSGINLAGSPVTLVVSNNFAISLDNATYTNSISIPSSGGAVSPTLVYVLMKGATVGPQSGAVRITAAGASAQTIALSGVVDPPLPVVRVTTNSLPTTVPQFSTPQGRPSAFGFFTTSASNLVTNVTILAPTNYEVSLRQNAGYGPRVVLTNKPTIPGTPVYIRLTGAQLMPVTTTNTVTVSTGPIATNFSVTGQVTNAVTPVVILSGALTNFSTVQGLPSASQAFQVTGEDVTTNVTVEAPEYYEVSILANSGFGPRIQFPAVNYGVPTTFAYVRLADNAPVSDNITGVIRGFTTDVDGTIIRGNDLDVGGSVTSNTAPFIVADPKALSGFEAVTNGVSTSQRFVVGGTNLNDFLNIAAPTSYQVSTNTNGPFGNVLSLAPATPGAIAQDRGLNYTNNPTSGQNLGSGFGPWQIVSQGNGGIFVGNPSNAGIVGMSPNSFGLFANPNNASNSVIARRAFTNNALATNQIFSFQWGNNFDSGASGNKGMSLLVGTNALLTINMAGSSAVTIRQGTNPASNMFTNYGTNAINVGFARTDPNTIRVTVPAGRDGGAGYTNTFVETNTPTGFEFYARGLQGSPADARDRAQPYFNNLIVTTNGGSVSANVASNNVFVRLVAATNAALEPVLGNVTLSSAGATNKFVRLSGTIYGAPQLTVAPTNLSGLITTAGLSSGPTNFTLITRNLRTDTTVAVGGGFEVSLDETTNYATSLTIPVSLAGEDSATFPVYVRIGPGAAEGTVASAVTLAASGFADQTASNSVAVAGTVFAAGGGAQIGLPAPSVISGLTNTRGQASASQSYVFDAVNLGTLPVVATVSSPNFEISTNANSGWGSAVTNFPISGTIKGAMNYVRISSNTSVPVTSNLTGTVTLSAPGTNAASRTVSLNGVVLPEPGIAVSPASITNLWTVQGFQSASSTFNLTASNLQGPVTVSAIAPLLVSADGGITYNSSVVLTNSGTTAGGLFNVVIGSNASVVNQFTNNSGITFSTPSALVLPAVRTVHTVVPRPDIVVNPTSLTNFRTVVGNPSDPPRTFAVSGTNLLTNITLAISNTGLPDKYEMTTNTALTASWTNAITLLPTFTNTTPGPPVPVAQDSAANYGSPATNTWTNGANGGSGFGPWSVVLSNGTGFFAGQFLGDPNAAGIGSFGTNAFGLFANPQGSAAFVRVERELAQPLQVGDTFSFQWAINWDSGAGGNKGFDVYTGSPGAGQIINVNNGASDVITFNGANTGFGFGTNPMTWSMFYSNPTTLVITANDRDGSGTFTTNLTVSAAPKSVRFYASVMQSANNAQPYFNNLLVTRPGAPIPSGGVVPNTTLSVRLKATAPIGPAQQQIDLTSGQYAQPETVTLDGVVLPKPVYTVTPSAITNLFTVTNTPSLPGTFLVNAVDLVTNLVVRAPANAPAAFEISTNSAMGFTNVLSIPPGSGTLANFPIYVRIGAWPAIQRVSNNLTFSNRFAATELSNVGVAGDVLEANPGDPRPGFTGPSANGAINSVSAGTNGTFYIGGNFTRLVRTAGALVVTNDFVRVARILTNGVVDTAFDPVAGPNDNVRAVSFSTPRSLLYLGGSFTSVDGVARAGLAAMKASDGSVDVSFAPQLQGDLVYVNAIVQQPDGKILVGGNFSSMGGLACANFARLLPDGTLDPEFVPPNPNGEVRAIALQPDGKILIGGAFGKVGEANSPSIARLNIDGTFDATFVAGTGFNAAVNTLAVLPDRSIVAGGQFTIYKGSPGYNRMARILPDGTLDKDFNYSAAPTGGFDNQVTSLLVRPTGSIFTTGYFTQFGTNLVGRVTQMLPDGTLDTRFNPAGAGANGNVLASATLSTGDLVVVGGFESYDGVPASGISVLAGYNGLVPIITSPSFYTVNAGEPVNFSFTSTGAAPIVFAVTNTNGSPVLPAGVNLAASGAFAGYPMKSGTFDMRVTSQPSSGPPSEPTPFTLYVVPVPVSYESWTKAWFGNSWSNPAVAGPGISAPNPSGLNNFTIYALNGGNPLTLGPDIAPSTQIEFGTNGLRYLTYTANRNPLAPVSYSVFYSTNLTTPWLSGTNLITTLIDTPELLKVRPNSPMSQELQQFLRLRIWGATNVPR